MQKDAEQMAGFSMVKNLASPSDLAMLAQILGESSSAGQRGLLRQKEIRQFAESGICNAAIRPWLSGRPRPVRAIFFDKSPTLNWLVAWHQDLTISVKERKEVPGFGPWSLKDGLVHVQPPIDLLERMVTLRIHLDKTDQDNGALRLLPGSHLQGRLSPEAIESWRSNEPEFTCAANPGDALLMRPLILHASGKSTSSTHRRILHIEYTSDDLPAGLEWHELA